MVRLLDYLSDYERWEWFGAGDKMIAPPKPRAMVTDNSFGQALFEIGLVVAVPLALAATAKIAFGQ